MKYSHLKAEDIDEASTLFTKHCSSKREKYGEIYTQQTLLKSFSALLPEEENTHIISHMCNMKAAPFHLKDFSES